MYGYSKAIMGWRIPFVGDVTLNFGYLSSLIESKVSMN